MTNQIDNLFTELDREKLSEHAGRWAKKEKYNGHIVNISVHPYIDRPGPYCYAVVFQLDFNQPGQNREESKETEIEKEIVWDEMELVKHTSFKKVYKGTPPEGYEKEWFFYPEYQDKKLPDYIHGDSWQLYPKADEKEQEQAEVVPPIAAPPIENYFHFKGGGWEVGFKGEKGIIPKLDGIKYIAFLLDKPCESISNMDLYHAVSGETPDNTMIEGAAIGEGLNVGISKQEISDAKTRKVCWDNYQQLQEQLPCAGMEQQEEIQAKMDKLLPFLKVETRNFATPEEKKVQSNIKKRLDVAFAAISKASMGPLATHLRSHIKPDDAYGRKYTGDITWDVLMR